MSGLLFIFFNPFFLFMSVVTIPPDTKGPKDNHKHHHKVMERITLRIYHYEDDENID